MEAPNYAQNIKKCGCVALVSILRDGEDNNHLMCLKVRGK